MLDQIKLGERSLSRYSWNQRFETWARPLSETENQRCQNAESVIRSALNASARLAAMDLRVFAQGSYRANTNVRADSDVDICVCNRSSFFTQYPDGVSDTTLGYTNTGLTFSDFKNLVGEALTARFTYMGVTRGDKAFNVHENSYRIEADVIPTFEYRDFYRKYDGSLTYREGVKFFTDGSKGIINWPDQTYENGTAKTNSTGRQFKRVVRVLKGLRNEMQSAQVREANNIASFLIESLIWNVPDSYFVGDNLYDVVSNVLLHAWYCSYAEDRCSEWVEVNNIKYLFRPSQPWTRDQAATFLWSARQYVGFPS